MPDVKRSSVLGWLLARSPMCRVEVSEQCSLVPTPYRLAKAGSVMRASGYALLAAVVSLDAGASAIYGINHTDLAITRFSVNGRSGIDTIGPHQGGGGGCCYVAPKHWMPGMTVEVDWQTGASAASKLADEFPGFSDEVKYDEWLDKLEAQRRKHSRQVLVPDYTDQKVCGITVHFLPCDEIQVTTSCFAFRSPEYPIKTPLLPQAPEVCPK